MSFDETEFSESKYAKLIAKKFNTQHVEIKLSPQIFLDNIKSALDDMDHPSGDGVNSWVVSKYTKKQNVKMVFSGLGGDELFMGYPFYRNIIKLYKFNAIFKANKYLKIIISFVLNIFSKSSNSIKKVKQLLKINNPSFKDFYQIARQNFLDEDLKNILNFDIPKNHSEDSKKEENILKNNSHNSSKISVLEIENYLNNILLRDTDQMSMAHSLEVRVPFLDHNFVELVLSINDQFKNSNSPKKLLFESFKELIPDEIFYRKKMGFTFPFDKWLRNELFNFSDQMIKNLSKRKYFNSTYIIKIWKDFNNKKIKVPFTKIWSLIVLEYWLQKNNISE